MIIIEMWSDIVCPWRQIGRRDDTRPPPRPARKDTFLQAMHLSSDTTVA